ADAAHRKDMAELNLDTAEPPRQIFDQSPYVIDDGSRRVEFYFFGWAHTRGDGFAYLPKEQVLCTGDAVTNGPYNGMGDGFVANWPKVVHRARQLKVKHVLPAHGPSGGPEILAGEEQFLNTIYGTVKKAMGQGKRLEDLVEKSPAGSNRLRRVQLLLAVVGLGAAAGQKWDPACYPICVPRLEKPPRIDGDLSEWKYVAFTDGVWDILRVRQAPWYDPTMN